MPQRIPKRFSDNKKASEILKELQGTKGGLREDQTNETEKAESLKVPQRRENEPKSVKDSENTE